MMSFSDLIKKFDKHKEHYDLFTEIISELQPIAFLISASLILAVFFKEESISRKYAIFASLSFFLAYLGFAFYKITNKYRLLFYWGLSLVLIGTYLIYSSFGGILSIIYSIENKGITILLTYIVLSIIILMTRYSLDNSDKNNLRYKIFNKVFYIIVLFILIYVPIGIYLNLTFIPVFVAFLLLTLIFLISIIKFSITN